MMKKKSLVYSADENTFAKEISILEKPGEMRILSNPIAWKIINLLSGHPMYPAQIAKELKIYEQSAYYYIRKLLAIKAIGASRDIICKRRDCETLQDRISCFWNRNELGREEI